MAKVCLLEALAQIQLCCASPSSILPHPRRADLELPRLTALKRQQRGRGPGPTDLSELGCGCDTGPQILSAS